MNIKFNDYEDIAQSDVDLIKLKEKNDIASNFFSIVRLYNSLTKHKVGKIRISYDRKRSNFSLVTHVFHGVIHQAVLNLQSEEFIPSLDSHNKISSNPLPFDYSFSNKKENILDFISKCARPQCFSEFSSKYKSEIAARKMIDEETTLNEYKEYDKINMEYLKFWHQQDVKKLYYFFNKFISVDVDDVQISFKRGMKLDNNCFNSISFIGKNKREVFDWNHQMAFLTSNMLSKNSVEVDRTDIDNLNHILVIKNTLVDWLKFDE